MKVHSLLACCVGVMAVIAAVVSCSSSETQATGGTAGEQGTGGAQPEASTPEASKDAPPDKTVPDVVEEPEAAAPVCPAGSAGTIIDTECQLIAQDCADPTKSCTPITSNGKQVTTCMNTGNGFMTKGQKCKGQSECAAGLVCVFGHCSPYCCSEAQYEICGPGGLCNIQRQIGSGYVIHCSYQKGCAFWANECDAEEYCHPVSLDGTGACIPASGATPLPEGSLCDFNNDCGNDMICVPKALSSEAYCRYLCKRVDADAGVVDAGAGKGGCPDGQFCGDGGDYPSWLGVCTPK